MAPLAATVAASVALGMGLVLARADRERRGSRRLARQRRLGLLADEPLSTGLQRMALAQIDLALELISSAGPDAAGEQAVHETRKALKRLRAIVGLLAQELGEAASAREDAVLRDVARSLSGARDAEVMLSTLDGLVARHPRKLAGRRGVDKLRRRLRAEHARMQRRTLGDVDARRAALDALRALRCRVAAWNLPCGDGIEPIEHDLRRVYRHGRRRHRRLRRGGGGQTRAMHRWRKRVKDLRYSAEVLQRRGPVASSTPGGRGGRRGRGGDAERHARRLRALARRADELGELLGEEHDLAVFAQRLRAGGKRGSARTWQTGRRTRRTLLSLVAKRRRRLRRRALRDGRRLYKDKPGRFARGMRTAYAADAPARPLS